MDKQDQNYKLQILKMVINQYLDESVSVTEEGLNTLQINQDKIVWELATKIYRQSGHKDYIFQRINQTIE